MSLPQSAHAAQVVITITGAVASAHDISGVFGPPNGDLTGNTFTLVFTFDDTQGTPTTASCGGMPYQTGITSTPTSSPGTATLTIGGKSFTFGVLNAGFEANSEVYRSYASNPSCSANSLIYLSAGDGYYLNGSGINGHVEPADGTILTSNPNWEAPFSDSNLYANPNNDYTISFEISELGSTGQYVSDGYLIPQIISVSGPYTCSAGDSPVLPPPTPGVAEHQYVVKDLICSPLLRPSSLPCTAENVFSVLREFPTPVDEGRQVNTCDVTYIPPIISLPRGFPFASTLAGVSYVGHVVTYVDTSALSITNVTLPDHTFYPGQVTRSVINENGDIYIQSVGTGTGPNEPWNTEAVWEIIGPLIWHSADTDIFRRFNVYPLRPR
jgi:hypothetical protein